MNALHCSLTVVTFICAGQLELGLLLATA